MRSGVRLIGAKGNRKSSVLKKGTKTLLRGCRGLPGDSLAKVFASFFKKKRLLTSPGRALHPAA
jgi:hypothetical protein